jgi:hypothetical protein
MKKNDLFKDIFDEKMASSLKSRILENADQLLENNRQVGRRNFLNWLFGIGAATATAAISFIYIRHNTNEHQQLELAQSIEMPEDIQSEEDFELLAELDTIEDLDLVDSIDEES